MLILVVGQTASGKSGLGIDLANVLGGPESSAIVGMDAMQLYRGLDVGTAKTPVAERLGIDHYQIDQLDPQQDASVAAYQIAARADVDHLLAEGRHVLAVGGSGLYARALFDDLTFPGVDPEIRARLEQELEEGGPQELHRRLAQHDPASAERIHERNGRRIVRALEVFELTGRPFSATLPRYEFIYPVTAQLAIGWEDTDLDRRIDQRTSEMFHGAEGTIVDETRALLESGRNLGTTAARATGYAEALAVLRGDLTVDEAESRVALATRQLARRQMKWFRRDPRITWLRGDAKTPVLEQALATLDLP